MFIGKWYNDSQDKRFQGVGFGREFNQIKTTCSKHGEVFTPAWMVQKMLDTPGVKEACESVYKTF